MSTTGDLAFLLAAAAKKEAGENALPAVSGSDNGKVLQVVDGAWAASEKDFVVTFTKSGGSWSANKNSLDVYDALAAGKNVIGNVAGSSVTTDQTVSGFTLILPLVGKNNSNAYVFGGAYQSANNQTVFVSISLYGTTVDEYSRTIVAAQEPLWIEYEIAGAPVGNVYPLTALGVTLADIHTALTNGRQVIAIFGLSGDNAVMQLASTGARYVSFSTNAYYNNAFCLFIISHYLDGNDDEVCECTTVPLNTSVMTYDSGTNTLAITQA